PSSKPRRPGCAGWNTCETSSCWSWMARVYEENCSDPFSLVVAEELGDYDRRGARLAEGDPAVLAQGDLVALDEQLGVAFDGDVGAVGAVVLEHELVLAVLDGAVLARGHVVFDDQAGRGIAADAD